MCCLLQHGADVEARIPDDADAADEHDAYPYGSTALHMAAAACVEEPSLAEALLQHGASVDARSKEEQLTPLMLASHYSLSLTHCLLAAGASPLATDAGGECALQKCVTCERTLDRYNVCWDVLRRTDEAHTARARRTARYGREWPFAEDRLAVAPFIAAALLQRAYALRAFAPAVHVGDVAVAAAAQLHGADAPITRMLRLARAGVPLSWRRDNAAAFPPAFRAVVRTLLLCVARGARLHALSEPDGFLCHADEFDAVVARLARLDVWPTFPCKVGAHTVEHVSVFDFAVVSAAA